MGKLKSRKTMFEWKDRVSHLHGSGIRPPGSGQSRSTARKSHRPEESAQMPSGTAGRKGPEAKSHRATTWWREHKQVRGLYKNATAISWPYPGRNSAGECVGESGLRRCPWWLGTWPGPMHLWGSTVWPKSAELPVSASHCHRHRPQHPLPCWRFSALLSCPVWSLCGTWVSACQSLLWPWPKPWPKPWLQACEVWSPLQDPGSPLRCHHLLHLEHLSGSWHTTVHGEGLTVAPKTANGKHLLLSHRHQLMPPPFPLKILKPHMAGMGPPQVSQHHESGGVQEQDGGPPSRMPSAFSPLLFPVRRQCAHVG